MFSVYDFTININTYTLDWTADLSQSVGIGCGRLISCNTSNGGGWSRCQSSVL